MQEDDGDLLGPGMFFASAFPPEEYEVAIRVSLLLTRLAVYTHVDFSAALDLYRHCERSHIAAIQRGDLSNARGYAKQAFVPARDGAMTIYHFGKALEIIRGRIGFSPILRARVYAAELRDAFRDYKRYFPKALEMRHGVAHTSEVLGNIKHEELLSSASPYPDLRNRIFSMTWDKKTVSYALTDETHNHLIDIYDRTAAAFRMVDAHSIVAIKEGHWPSIE